VIKTYYKLKELGFTEINGKIIVIEEGKKTYNVVPNFNI